METNNGIITEPFKSYYVTTEDNSNPVLATRTRNVWNTLYGGFVAYDQFIITAELVNWSAWSGWGRPGLPGNKYSVHNLKTESI